MSQKMEILVADQDDDARSHLIKRLAETDDLHGSGAKSIAEIEWWMRDDATTSISALVTEVSFPDGDGRILCSKLRAQGIYIPVIIVSDRDSEEDIERAMDLSATDYVEKPYKFRVLTARIRAHLRTFQNISPTAVLTIGPYTFHPYQKMLMHTTTRKRYHLTEKETKILRYLYNADHPVKKRELLEEVFCYDQGASTHTLETHIYRIRQKIEPDPMKHSIIISINGGYVLDRHIDRSATDFIFRGELSDRRLVQQLN